MALHRGVPGAATPIETACFASKSTSVGRRSPPSQTRALEREYVRWSKRSSSCAATMADSSAFVRSITHPGSLADTAGYSPDLNVGQKLELLETLDVVERLKLALQFQQDRLASTRPQAHRRRRDRRTKTAARVFPAPTDGRHPQGLGENEARCAEYRAKITAATMPEAVQQQAERELARFERMGDSNAEASMIRTYLDWLLAVPWSKRSKSASNRSMPGRCSTPTRRSRRREAADTDTRGAQAPRRAGLTDDADRAPS
jgi:ATP-dependent Lon protease